MNKVVTKAEACKYVLWIVLGVLALTILPFRLWRQEIKTTSHQTVAGVTDAVTEETAVMQMFVAQYDHLDSIGICLQEGSQGAVFDMLVFDRNFALLRQETLKVEEDATVPGFYPVRLNLDTEVGQEYYYTLEGLRGDALYLGYEMTETSGFIYNGPLQIAGQPVGGYNLIAEYNYREPLTKGRTLAALAGILLMILLIGRVCDQASKKGGWAAELVTMEWALKRFGNPAVILLGLTAVIMIGPLHLFSIHIADLVIFEMGAVFLTLSLLYLINRKRGPEDRKRVERVSELFPHLLQSAFVALALWACTNYMNGLYEVFHDIAYRQYLVFIGLAVLCMFTRKMLMNWYNIVLVIGGVIGTQIYYRTQLPEMVDKYHVSVLKWTCILAVLILILAAGTIRILCEKKPDLSKISPVYAILTGILAAGMIIWRNTRWWPVMMVVSMLVVSLHYLAWEKRSAFLNNVCNGILLNFVCTMVWCLWCRPYQTFLYTRYSMNFHTVTETAAYLTLVLTAAVIRLLAKYDETGKIAKCGKEILLFGIVASYELFTMSRTGLASVLLMGFVLWFVMLHGKGIEKLKKLGGSLIMIVFAVVWCFPITFTMQRCIPAMTGRVYDFEIEHFLDGIYVAGDWDNINYISFGRFAEIFANKMFGTPEDSFDLDQYILPGVENVYTLEYYHLADEQRVSKPLASTGAVGAEKDALEELGKAQTDSLSGQAMDPSMQVPRYDDGDSEEEFDVTNGRTSIYRSYIEQLNLFGHDEMGALLETGEIAMHAHDIYLQVAFDHGILVGAVFVIWVMATVISALLFYQRKRGNTESAALPLAVILGYGGAGIVEWVAHPCNPLGFVLLLIVVPLALSGKKDRNE